MTAFNLFTLFRADNVCMKECELIKGGHTFGLLAVRHEKKNCHNLRFNSQPYNAPFQDVSYCTSKHEKSFWEL